jgi:HEAT repeat protein
MRRTRYITLFLVLFLIFGGLFYAQREEENREARKTYEEAKAYIYQKNWEKAIDSLNTIIQFFEESEYLDDSLYWLSYSMNKLSSTLANIEMQLEMQKEALHNLDSLIEEYRNSSWVDDAKFLRIEIAEDLAKKGLKDYRQYINDVAEAEVREAAESLEKETAKKAAQEAVDPELELKLVALNALLNLEENKAFPILVKLIKKEDDPKIRERAVFILSQKDHPDVLPLMIDLATKDPDKKIKETAIFWLGQRKGKESTDALIKIYDQTTDSRLKQRLIHALSQNRSKKAKDKLLEIIKKEKNRKAREMAIFFLAQQRDKEALNLLSDIYFQTDDLNLKKIVIHAISQYIHGELSHQAVNKMIEMARKEKDMELKKQLTFWLGQSKNEEAMKFLKEILEK